MGRAGEGLGPPWKMLGHLIRGKKRCNGKRGQVSPPKGRLWSENGVLGSKILELMRFSNDKMEGEVRWEAGVGWGELRKRRN